MTATKQFLDVFIDVNVLLVLALVFWWAVRGMIQRTPLKSAYSRQLWLLKVILVCTALSPFLALFFARVNEALWPGYSMALSDVVVAAYLRGEIAMPAAEFEAWLNTRGNWTEALLHGNSPWLSAALAILAMGAAVVLFRMALAALCLHRTLSDSYLWRRTRSTDILLSDTVRVPFAARGLRRHYVVLPSSLLTDARGFRFALAHEFQHLRQGDVGWELVIEALRPLLFWNPAFHILKRQLDRLRELSCDQAVITEKGMSAHDYANCLLDFCESRIGLRQGALFRVGLVNTGSSRAKSTLRARIIAVEAVRRDTMASPYVFAVTGAMLAMAITVAATSVQPSGDWSHDRLMLSTVINLERLEAINSRGGF